MLRLHGAGTRRGHVQHQCGVLHVAQISVGAIEARLVGGLGSYALVELDLASLKALLH